MTCEWGPPTTQIDKALKSTWCKFLSTASPAPKSWEIPSKKITFPWGVHVSFISRGYNPIYIYILYRYFWVGFKTFIFYGFGEKSPLTLRNSAFSWPFWDGEHVTFSKVVGDPQWSVIKRSPLTWIFVWFEHLSLSKIHAKKNRSTSTKSQVSQQRQVNLAPTKTFKDWSEMLVYTSLSLQTYTQGGPPTSYKWSYNPYK